MPVKRNFRNTRLRGYFFSRRALESFFRKKSGGRLKYFAVRIFESFFRLLPAFGAGTFWKFRLAERLRLFFGRRFRRGVFNFFSIFLSALNIFALFR